MLNLDFTRPPLYTAPIRPKTRTTVKGKRPFLQNIEHISTFAYNNVAIDRDGTVWTWGCDTMGQRGKKISYDYPPQLDLVPQKRMEHAVAVSAGGECTYCVTADGLLWGWGINRYGTLGTCDAVSRPEPTVILDGVKAVHSGMDTTFCVREDNSLWGWGSSCENCPIPMVSERSQKPLYIMDNVFQASCNDDMAMAIKTDGTLWGWGINITDRRIPVPTLLMENMKWQSVPGHGCGYAFAVTCGGDLYSFGISDYGSMTSWQNRGDESLPIKVLAGAKKVWTGHYVSMVLMEDGRLLSTGHNGYGACGTGKPSAPFHRPAFVMSNVKEAAIGWNHSMVLQENGDLWIFGDDYDKVQPNMGE